MSVQLTALEKKLVNGWQKGFPLVPRPYARIARDLALQEEQVIALLASLKQRGILSRVGAVVKPNSVGSSCLVAMAVPPDKLIEVAQIVGAHPQVNHNYERENELNLWFVVTASSQDDLHNILSCIERESGLETTRLPMKKAYHINLGFRI